MRVFFVVLARDANLVLEKARELTELGYPFVVICGEPVDHPNVVFRQPSGKYDAINFSLNFIPNNFDVVAFNDVDTRIHNLGCALGLMQNSALSLVYAKVRVQSGPQLSFYKLLDPLRRWIPIAASGELIIVRQDALRTVLPVKQCKSEDSYILFKILENGGKIAFCEDAFVETVRTANSKQEEGYKRRTTGGIYQALSMTRPPILVRLFYTLLPIMSPLLMLTGKKGYYWSRGIIQGYLDYLRGDEAGTWKSTYKVNPDPHLDVEQQSWI